MKRLISIILSICMLMVLVPCQVFAVKSLTYENIQYIIKNNEITITGCDDDATQISVPAEISGYPVTKITGEAFYYKRNLASIILPDTLTDIGCGAFVQTAFSNDVNNYDENGQLYIGKYFIGYKSNESVCIVKEGTKIIAGGAFYQYPNSVKEVVLPDSVITIGELAFGKCYLKKINIPDGLKYIKERAFDCQGLEEIDIPKSVVEIGNEALIGVEKNINVSEQNKNYSSLNGALFDKNKTRLLSIPPRKTYTFVPISVINISGLGSWYYRYGIIDFFYEGSENEWSKIEIDDDSIDVIQNANIHFNSSAPLPTDIRYTASCGENSTWTLDYNGTLTVTGIGDVTEKIYLSPLCDYGGGIYTVVIGEGITGISDRVFFEMDQIKNVYIPKSVKNIGEMAFEYCFDLEDVYYAGSEDDWNKIDIDENNYYLSEVTIHFNCTYESTYVVASGTCGEKATWTLDSDGTLTISGSGEMNEYPVPWEDYKDEIKNVIINEGITAIGYDSFRNCKNLTNISIPNSIEEIASSEFWNCSSLQYNKYCGGEYLGNAENKYIYLANSNSNKEYYSDIHPETRIIGSDAFSESQKLETVVIPELVVNMSDYALYRNNNLKSVIFKGNALKNPHGKEIAYNGLTIYCFGNKSGWTDSEYYNKDDNTWMDHKLCIWNVVESIDVEFAVGERNYDLTLKNVWELIETTTVDNTKYPRTFFYEPGATFISHNAIPNNNFGDGLCLEADYFFGKDGDVEAEKEYNIEDTFKQLARIMNNGETVDGTGNIMLGDVFFCTSNSTDYSAEIGSVYDFEKKSNVIESGTYGDDLTWKLDIDGTLTISGNGAMPDDAEPWENYKDTVKSVIITDGITNIGYRVFGDCNKLKEITITDSCSISVLNQGLFYGLSSLETLNVGSSVTTIYCAFQECSNLKEINLPDHYVKIESGALKDTKIYSDSNNWVDGNFYFKDYLNGIDIDANEIYVKDGTKYISYGAFGYGGNWKTVHLPKSIEVIENYQTKMSSPSTDIYYAGTEEEWDKIDIKDDLNNVTVHFATPETEIVASGTCGEKATWTLDDSGTLTISGNGKMTDYEYFDAPWYSERSKITSAIISNGITSIGMCAFASCSLASVTMPDSVTSIGERAFVDCSSLTSVTIPDSVTDMGDGAFYGCSSLTSVTISTSVTSIGTYAFYDCSSLTSVTIPDSVTSIGGDVFLGCSALENIIVDKNNEYYSSKDGVLFNKDKTTLICCPGSKKGTYIIPGSVKNIDECAFNGCSSLISVTIPDSVTNNTTDIGN